MFWSSHDGEFWNLFAHFFALKSIGSACSCWMPFSNGFFYFHWIFCRWNIPAAAALWDCVGVPTAAAAGVPPPTAGTGTNTIPGSLGSLGSQQGSQQSHPTAHHVTQVERRSSWEFLEFQFNSRTFELIFVRQSNSVVAGSSYSFLSTAVWKILKEHLPTPLPVKSYSRSPTTTWTCEGHTSTWYRWF